MISSEGDDMKYIYQKINMQITNIDGCHIYIILFSAFATDPMGFHLLIKSQHNRLQFGEL
jgi:hypothetical protein